LSLIAKPDPRVYLWILVRQCPQHVAYLREKGVEADRDFMLKDARFLQEGLWRMVQLAQEAAEALDSRIEDEDLDGQTEATELLRETLERVQSLSLELSEELDAYQERRLGEGVPGVKNRGP
jgi:hypothetical protein